MAAKKIIVKEIILALGGFLLLCVLAVLLFAWRSMSYDIDPVPATQAEISTWRFDDFSMALPRNFSIASFKASLNWPEARIVISEGWRPNHEEALLQFEESKKYLAEKYETADISAEMGVPAIMVTDIPEIELADKPFMLIALVSENVQLNFMLMHGSPPADGQAWESILKSRVRDFLQYYHPSPTPEVAADSEMRTLFGTVDPGVRDGYVFSLGFAVFARDAESFYFSTITDGERFVSRPNFGAKIPRFFQNLSNSGVLSGIGIEELNLGGVPGHEILRKHPYLGDRPVALEFDWQEAPEGVYAKTLALSFTGEAVKDPAACYGQWRQILESVRFNKQ